MMGFTPLRRARAGRQFVDVGIAEEHAVTYAAGLARAGAKPVIGLYGVLLQRAYDQFWHDLCLNSLPAFVLDFGSSVYGTSDATHLSFFDLALQGALPNLRCLAPVCREEYLAMLDWALDQDGCPGTSDATHLSFFDLALQGALPNLRCLAPVCREEYLAMLDWALDQDGCPVVIRVPGNGVTSREGWMQDEDPVAAFGSPRDEDPVAAFGSPRYQVVRGGSKVAVLALGSFFDLGERVCDALRCGDGVAGAIEARGPRCGVRQPPLSSCPRRLQGRGPRVGQLLRFGRARVRRPALW